MDKNIYIGLDVHKEKISVAIANGCERRSKPEFYGEIYNTGVGISRMLKKLSKGRSPEELHFCYEAGPCGYGLHRHLTSLGYSCDVVAPSLIPKKAGDRVKTNRRDSLLLARLHRSGELTAVWVPDAGQEAIRDLERARGDAKKALQKAKQNLNSFLLRHDKRFPGKSRWTQAHWQWLSTVSFEFEAQRVVHGEYIHTIETAINRLTAIEKEMRTAFESWSLRPLAEALMALRGIEFITAMTILAEIGDLRRFEAAPQLMSYLGLCPSEYSTGDTRQRGAITKAGNVHVRTALIEAAWAYRLPAKKSAVIQRRAKNAPPAVQEIAWKAQKRLSSRFFALMAKRKKPQKVVTAVARELCGFIWAIGREIELQPSC